MSYKAGFVVNVVRGSQIIEDENGTVAIPFDSEYKIRLKNKNNRDAVVKVSIDGRNVTKLGDVIVRKDEVIELERFVDDLNEGNKFRFVNLTDIHPSLRDNPLNGIITVQFRLVKESKWPIIFNPWYYPVEPFYYPHWRYYDSVNFSETIPSATTTTSGTIYSNSGNICFCSAQNISDVSNGKTVEGNYSDQKFSYGYIGNLEYTETTITLKLVGYETGSKKSKEIYTYPGSRYCTQCGYKVEETDKFCSGCGNKL
jgi:hypothetical protein